MGCPTLFNPLALGEPLWSRGGMLKGNKGIKEGIQGRGRMKGG